MEIIHDDEQLKRIFEEAVKVSGNNPVLLDRFLNDAIEVDVDAICDGRECFCFWIMEHIEEAEFTLEILLAAYLPTLFQKK